MRKLNSNPNVDNSDLSNYPDGRIKNDTGAGNGTPVNESVYGDAHQTIAKLMRLYDITGNNLPDNETNGFQIVDALRALASKNDFVLPLTLSGGILQVPIKIGNMLENEQVVCKVGFDLASETQIKGLDSTVFAFTSNGSFKTNEYVRLIKTSSSVKLVRLADDVSLNAMVLALNYLKKATQLEENAGAIDTVGTTPLSNLTAFVKRVIGADSINYIAKPLGNIDERNGLLSKEDKAIIDYLSNRKKSVGAFLTINVGTSYETYTPYGDILSAINTAGNGIDSVVRIVLKPDKIMTNTEYRVKIYLESLGAGNDDATLNTPVFTIISNSTFDLNFRETIPRTQSLKVHLEVEQY